MKNNRRVTIFVVVLFLLFTDQVIAQTKVLGYELGKSTYEEVKEKLPKGVKVEKDVPGPCDYGGPFIFTGGTGYGIDGLLDVGYRFDQKRTLVVVMMRLEDRRLQDIKKILASKYRSVRSENHDKFFLFRASRDYVYLYPCRDEVKDKPGSYIFGVQYMTNAAYRLDKSRERQTAEYNKAQERENKQMLEKEAAKEAAKF